MTKGEGFRYLVAKKDRKTGFVQQIYVNDVKSLKGWKVIEIQPWFYKESGLRSC